MYIQEKPAVLSETECTKLMAKNVDLRVVDAFKGAVEELFFIENPKYKKNQPGVDGELNKYIKSFNILPIYIHYPWKNILVKTVPEDIYYKLRTSRNRHIISDEEQKSYRSIKVGIVGLSVGSAVLSSIVASGGPKDIKIADFDILEITNLNRIRAKLTDIGEEKTNIAAREVWEMDPFANLELWNSGVTKETLSNFIKEPKLGVFIDEMDSLDLKIASRFICRESGIPVLMATDNGDSIILDVERYDLDKNLPIFHGLLGDPKPEDFANLDFKMWLQLATKIVGPTYLTERMQESLASIGRTIPSVPQLGTTANIAGAAISFCVRRIASDLPLKSGRYTVSLEQEIIPDYKNEEQKLIREQKTKDFIEGFSKKI